MDQKEKLPLLIVDDEDDLRETLQDLLTDIATEIVTASDGKEAFDIIKKRPDLCAVLSDVRMPVCDGLELLADIRREFNPIPFVILTGVGDTKSYQQAIQLNATDFLPKPFDPDQLRAVVDRALRFGAEIHRAEREINEIATAFKIPSDKLEVFKRVKRTSMLMRVESSLYLKKPTGT